MSKKQQAGGHIVTAFKTYLQDLDNQQLDYLALNAQDREVFCATDIVIVPAPKNETRYLDGSLQSCTFQLGQLQGNEGDESFTKEMLRQIGHRVIHQRQIASATSNTRAPLDADIDLAITTILDATPFSAAGRTCKAIENLAAATETAKPLSRRNFFGNMAGAIVNSTPVERAVTPLYHQLVFDVDAFSARIMQQQSEQAVGKQIMPSKGNGVLTQFLKNRFFSKDQPEAAPVPAMPDFKAYLNAF